MLLFKKKKKKRHESGENRGRQRGREEAGPDSRGGADSGCLIDLSESGNENYFFLSHDLGELAWFESEKKKKEEKVLVTVNSPPTGSFSSVQ